MDRNLIIFCMSKSILNTCLSMNIVISALKMSYVNVRIIISSELIYEIYNKRECLLTDCIYVDSILCYYPWDSAILWQFIHCTI